MPTRGIVDNEATVPLTWTSSADSHQMKEVRISRKRFWGP
jgi:hypothetical protein